MGAKTSDLLLTAVSAAEDRKATDTVVLDLKGLSTVTDYFIICSGRSDTNVKAIAEGIEEKLKQSGQRPFGVEGLREGTWVLMDYVDFVIHVFHHEKRAALALEELWKDARRVPLPSKAPAAKEGG